MFKPIFDPEQAPVVSGRLSMVVLVLGGQWNWGEVEDIG